MEPTRRRRYRVYIIIGLLGLVLCTGLPALLYYTLFYTKTFREPPPADRRPEDELVDDKLEDKKPKAFDPALVDRRPLHGWSVNQSAAVIQLDIAPADAELETGLLELRPSFAAAVQSAEKTGGRQVLPSVN